MERIMVAVKASKEIPKTALVWALTHIVQPGDCIALLVIVPSHSSGRKWGFPRFAGDCAHGHRRAHTGTSSEQKSDIADSCSQMIFQLQNVYKQKKINVKIKIVSGSPCGAVAAEAKRTQANWVIFDKQLKHEEKRCMEELLCNIVVMKRSQAKVLRLNLVGSCKKENEVSSSMPPEKSQSNSPEILTSPEIFTATEGGGTPSAYSSDPGGTSPFFNMLPGIDVQRGALLDIREDNHGNESRWESDSENLSCSSRNVIVHPWMSNNFVKPQFQSPYHHQAQIYATKGMLEDGRFAASPSFRSDLDFTGNLRDAISLSRSAPLGPPPLCTICQHKAPVFGKPPKWFSYAELEHATGGFSQTNFLAEGGFGSVYRGVLNDGQVVAVKQHKLASSQGDQEFCSEVEVLSCAQHRNVVMLIGFCIEDSRRMLVYEYICNGSLDSHLYGNNEEPLLWSARQKVAVGAARGLRYLHEECRVGCIVHRDMRPNNILITHDFEPLVGDFGLARWQPDGDTAVETRILGTFGYLAPEYTQSSQITEKADVYSFGVVLVELVTGRRAVDLTRPKGQQCLTEWARPLLEEYAVEELIDPRLENCYVEHEVHCMLHAASLCIRRDPQDRPRMSQVLHMLEGDIIMDSGRISTPGQSRRIWTDASPQYQRYSGPMLNEVLEGFTPKLSLDIYTKIPKWEKKDDDIATGQEIQVFP
ncbi:unnamed protein product [Cuscuta epithymum]|uniref:Protein kinase domain-containing protein n=1 Tax=Cuscuta epithymum TaxID=186058 RepID=A0AAV0F9R0_9ASTE|nr:unnamed protein product [Cuscuta epithymum]